MKNPSDLNDIGCFGGLNWTGVGAQLSPAVARLVKEYSAKVATAA